MKYSIFTRFLMIVFLVFAMFFFANQAGAQMPTKMIGNAWAPNWGWLNFGSSTAPRVNVDTNGNFTGYGWSPNIGWIRLGSDLRGPTGTDTGVKAVISNGGAVISGWMRACSAYSDPNDCGLTKPTAVKVASGTERGGWDGWFKMKNVFYSATTSSYSGYAWGDLVGGWVNFGAISAGSNNVACSSSVSSDNSTVTWSASVPGGSGFYNYSWTGSGPNGSDDAFSYSISSVLSNTITRSYGITPVRTVRATVVVTQGATLIGTCDTTAQVGASSCVGDCGPGGGSFIAKCSAVQNGSNIDWNSNYEEVNGKPILPIVSYLWSGYIRSGNIYTSDLNSSLNGLTSKSFTKPYVPNMAGRVVIKDSSNNSATSDYCSVPVDNSCKVNIILTGAGATLGQLKLNNGIITTAINSVVCGYNNSLGSTTPTGVTWKSDSCSGTVISSVAVNSGTKTICADFGGVGEVKISGTLAGNLVKVNCGSGCNYGSQISPVVSLPLAQIKMTAGTKDVSISGAGWDELLAAYNSSDACVSGGESKKPQICLGDVSNSNNCVKVGENKTLPVTTSARSLKFYFPDRCPGSDGVSVFHRTDNWNVKVDDKEFNLLFNDPSSSNKLR